MICHREHVSKLRFQEMVAGVGVTWTCYMDLKTLGYEDMWEGQGGSLDAPAPWMRLLRQLTVQLTTYVEPNSRDSPDGGQRTCRHHLPRQGRPWTQRPPGQTGMWRVSCEGTDHWPQRPAAGAKAGRTPSPPTSSTGLRGPGGGTATPLTHSML